MYISEQYGDDIVHIYVNVVDQISVFTVFDNSKLFISTESYNIFSDRIKTLDISSPIISKIEKYLFDKLL